MSVSGSEELPVLTRFLPDAVQYDGSKLSAGGLVAHDPTPRFEPLRNRRRSDIAPLLKFDGIIVENRGITLTEFYQQISRRLRDQFESRGSGIRYF